MNFELWAESFSGLAGHTWCFPPTYLIKPSAALFARKYATVKRPCMLAASKTEEILPGQIQQRGIKLHIGLLKRQTGYHQNFTIESAAMPLYLSPLNAALTHSICQGQPCPVDALFGIEESGTIVQ